MKPILRFIGLTERLGLWIAVLSLIGLVVLGLTEMVLRTFFETGLSISLEYSGYLVAVAFLGGSGWTLSEGGHIRVQVLDGWLNDKWRRVVGLITAAIALANRQGLAVLEAGGITTVVPDPALLKEMRQAARPMWQAFANDVGPEAEEVLRAFLAWKQAQGGEP